ncbi:hypothetical protein [Thiomonas sp.]|uniref:hypothetical protein n=1 Tax=Thiomonas sp. TaxID=2047785 RepID=UPI00261BBB8E|nr:hypothetical protein [Thiomonas sp.]
MLRRQWMWAAALAAALPVAAFAAPTCAPTQPVMVRFDGHMLPMQQTARVVQTAAGQAQVKTWTWRSPGGHERVMMQTVSGPGAVATVAPQMAQVQAQFAALDRTMAQQFAQLQRVMAQLPMPGFAPVLPTVDFAPAWVTPPLQVVVLQPEVASPARPAPAHQPALDPALPHA